MRLNWMTSIYLETVTEMLLTVGTKVIVIESFEKNVSAEEYLMRIADEFEQIARRLKH